MLNSPPNIDRAYDVSHVTAHYQEANCYDKRGSNRLKVVASFNPGIELVESSFIWPLGTE